MQPFARQGLLRRGGPFAAVALLAFAMTPLPPVTDGARVAGAVGLTLAILAAAVLVPWRRLPAGAVVLPPLAYFVVVALLRDADGGSRSGAGVLVALPVLWLALHGGCGQLLAAAGGAGLTFVVPLLVVGAPRYTAVDVEH